MNSRRTPAWTHGPRGGGGKQSCLPGFVGCLGDLGDMPGPAWVGVTYIMCTRTHSSLCVCVCHDPCIDTCVLGDLSVAHACTLVPEPGCVGVSRYVAPTSY